MKVPILMLLVLFLMPTGIAIHDPVTPGRLDTPGDDVFGYFQYNESAVRPPAELDMVLVFETRGEGARIQGSIETSGSEGSESLMLVDEELEPFSTHRISFTVLIQEIGSVWVRFAHDSDPARMRVGSVLLAGIAPVEVSLDGPGPRENLVSLPGAPAEMTLTITALPGFNLTDLSLNAPLASEMVDIGDLAGEEKFAATLRVVADDERFSGVDRSVLEPELSGFLDNASFSHPLYRTDGDDLEAIHPAVYVASESSMFIIPRPEVHLSVPTTFDVILLNAKDSPVRARGQVKLTLPGVPEFDRTFHIDERMQAASVEVLSLDWIPPAAGPWQANVRHDLSSQDYLTGPIQIQVSGPIEELEFQIPGSPLARGHEITVPIVLTASKILDLEDMVVTTRQAPLQGVISIHDLFLVQPIQEVKLEPGSASTQPLVLTPIATGSYDLYLMVETSEGISVHAVGTVTVAGSMSGWLLPWSPTLAIGILVGVHFVWRRRWVT